MSRELKRRAPLGLSRGSPGQEAQDRRNSDIGSSYLTIAPGVSSVSLNEISIPTNGAQSKINDALVARLAALETAHNNLLSSLRVGQVINGDRPRR